MYFIVFFGSFRKCVKVKHTCSYIYQYSLIMRSLFSKYYLITNITCFTHSGRAKELKIMEKAQEMGHQNEEEGRQRWRETEEKALGRKQRAFSAEPPRLKMEESNAVGSESLRIFVPVHYWEPGGSSRTGAEPSLQHSDVSTTKYQSGADTGGGWRWCALLPAPVCHWQANLSPGANSAKPAAATPLCKTRTQPGVSEACGGLENHLLGVLQSWVNTSRTSPRSPASQAAWAKVIKIEIKPPKQRQREEGDNAVGPKGLRMWVLLGLIVFFLALQGGMLLGQCCCLLDCYWLGFF